MITSTSSSQVKYVVNLQKKAKRACLSEGGLIRLLLKGYEPREKPDERFYDVMRELSAIGNNINQIARTVNARGFASGEDIAAITAAQETIWNIAERL